MTRQEAKQRIEKLKKVINYHRYLYHVLDRQEISESALDSLKKELFDLEEKYPEFITPDSPTQRVGGKPRKEFSKTRHLRPMLSFNDAFSEEDMLAWKERIEKLLSKEEIENLDYFCELKFDGLAIELTYQDGILKIGSTRGDGLVGEDVTQNIKTIEAIPLKIREKKDVLEDLRKQKLFNVASNVERNGLKQVVCRGEALISKRDFLEINKERLKNGLPLYANPRNIAAGSIRQLDPKITANRKLDSYLYALVSDLGQTTHQQEHQILKILGFKTSAFTKYCKTIEEVFQFHKYWQKKRSALDFEIDGVVVQVNNNLIFNKLGVAGKAPRGAIAYKFPLKQAETIVKDIVVQIGRTGAITPVAYFKPVKVGGVTITRATLHNEDEIRRLGVKIGDTVIVGRAGDVIPEIVKVLKSMRNGKEREFKMPKRCPACGSRLVRQKGEVVWRCPNPDCSARRRRYLYHFVSKGAFDIDGLGPKVIDQLLEESLINDAADIFSLRKGDLEPLERFAEKSAGNLVKAIQSRKKIPFARFIYALGINGVGEETAQSLADRFGNLANLRNATEKQILEIKDIGPKTALSIYSFFKDKTNIILLEKLKASGVKIIEQYKGSERGKEKKGRKLEKKTFLFTGSLDSMTRETAKDKVRELGGFIAESVSKNVDFLVVGKNPGSKLAKAKKAHIKILPEKEFLKMIKN